MKVSSLERGMAVLPCREPSVKGFDREELSPW